MFRHSLQIIIDSLSLQAVQSEEGTYYANRFIEVRVYGELQHCIPLGGVPIRKLRFTHKDGSKDGFDTLLETVRDLAVGVEVITD